MLVAYRELRSVGADGRPSAELPRRPIMIDGRAVGGWTRRLTRHGATVEVVLDATPSRRRREALHAAVDRFGAFVGLPATLSLRASS